jgi:hypothetical protein
MSTANTVVSLGKTSGHGYCNRLPPLMKNVSRPSAMAVMWLHRICKRHANTGSRGMTWLQKASPGFVRDPGSRMVAPTCEIWNDSDLPRMVIQLLQKGSGLQ